MHAIVNHLQIRPDADWSELAGKFDAFNKAIDHPDFGGGCLIRTDDRQGIILVLYKTREALDEISKNVAAPWFAEHIRPFMAGPVSRSIGEIVGGALTASA
jgi:hypothetical protein